MRLYWKIFLSFWISMTLMVMTGAIINHSLDLLREEDKADPLMAMHHTIKHLEHEPLNKVIAQWQQKKPPKIVRLSISDMDNRILFNNADTYRIKSLLAQINTIEPQHFVRRGSIYMGKIIDNPQQRIKLLVRMPKPRKLWHQQIVQNSWLRVLIALIVSAIVCFLLARYITRPIQRLRNTTAQLAKGEYSARSGIKITKRPDEIGLLAKDFDHMAEHLQLAVNNQQRLIRDISHELRSPIARLQVALELARQRLQLTESPELDRIDKETELLNQLIDQILRLPQLESGRTERDDTIDLVALLHSIANDANYEACKLHKVVKVSNEIDEALIQTRGDLLHSAIENVVRNALRYAPVDSTVNLAIRQKDSQYEICIEDNGPGVPESELNRIFDAFYRVSQARDRDSGGFGLGLSIARRAIELHDGAIKASNYDHGFRVQILLPTE